jgi:hypothetical protein
LGKVIALLVKCGKSKGAEPTAASDVPGEEPNGALPSGIVNERGGADSVVKTLECVDDTAAAASSVAARESTYACAWELALETAVAVGSSRPSIIIEKQAVNTICYF